MISRKRLAAGGGVIGAAVLIAALAGTRSFSPTVSPTASMRRRDLVTLTAGLEVGETDPAKYWRDAYGSVPSSKYSWCGVFALWVLRRALNVTWRWIAGVGFIYADDSGKRTDVPRLPVVSVPEPGDVAYYDQPYQHYAIVERVNNDGTATLIAGNTPNVSRYEEPLSKATAYYSIAPLV